MKRVLAVCLAAAMLTGGAAYLPAPDYAVSAAETEETMYGKLMYQLAGDHAEITGCLQTATKIEIPAEIDGLPVTVIGKGAFSECQYLSEITFPDSIAEIRTDALVGTKWLENQRAAHTFVIVNHILIDGTGAAGDAEIPEDVTYIGDKAFLNAAVTSVLMQENVTGIGSQAFYDCAALTSVDMLGGVTAIGNSAFSGCKALTDIVIPETVKSIGSHAFTGCTALKELHLPDGLVSIGDFAFYYCRALKTIDIPESVSDIGTRAFRGTQWFTDRQKENPLVIVNQSVCDGTAVVGTAVIPDNVTQICGSAFEGNTQLTGLMTDSAVIIGRDAFYGSGLTAVSLPATVSQMDAGAFQACKKLTAIEVAADNAAYCTENGVLYNRDKSVLMCYPAGKRDDAYSAPETVKEVCAKAFIENSYIDEITFPASTAKIGAQAMMHCNDLRNVTLLNPECEISDTKGTVNNNVKNGKYSYYGKITGYDNSTAQSFAAKLGCGFVSLGEAPVVLKDDINADGAVNLKDVVYLRRFIAGGWNVEISESAADINGDGKVNLKDVVLLRRRIAGGWE